MNVVGYGGGTDSTAMLIGLWRHHVPVDLILFADPGAEQPHTYAYLDTMSRWLENHGMPAITRVWYTEKNGQRLTLEQECLRSGTLPSIAYGYKKCSLKHKVAPQEKFCRHYQPCIDAWEKGEKVVKFIGYDAGEERRLLNALPHDLQDKKYQKEYPLMEWGWSRKDCIQAIRDAGLPLPGVDADGDPVHLAQMPQDGLLIGRSGVLPQRPYTAAGVAAQVVVHLEVDDRGGDHVEEILDIWFLHHRPGRVLCSVFRQ